jgi:phosphoglycerol transferase MdoB-like AlkP superfamily enzyme
MNLSFKNYYCRWVKNQLFLFSIFLSLMTFARLAFSFAFGDVSELQAMSGDFKSALLLGMRYDLMPLAYINALPFLIINLGYFLPGKFVIKTVRSLVVGLLLIGYLALLWLYVCDYGFYSYFQDHINILFFGFFEDDTVALLISIWKNYNLPFWLTILLLGHYGFYRFLKFLFSLFDFDLKVKKFDFCVILSLLSGVVLLAFMARGNFTRLPLSIEDAHISSNEFINEVSLNGVLTLNRAIKIRKVFGQKEVNYLNKYGFESWKEAFHTAYPTREVKKSLLESLKSKTNRKVEIENKPTHVVLVVMESFGNYWIKDQSDRFNILGSLKDNYDSDILFENFLPAENGTIGSIVSVATSQVIRPGARFLSESDFMKTPLQVAGHLPYKDAGYNTHFVYGGKLGWRDLGKYLKIQGYDNLWGADEIKEAMPELNNIGSKDLGNEWGIFDEYLYSFIEEQLRTATKPQFFLVLTTSNHPPFEYPSTYNKLPIEIEKEKLNMITVGSDMAHKRFLGLQYANHKVGEFLERIKSSALSDKVVVAITGDHSFWIAKGVDSDEEFKRFAVPLLITVPDRLKPKSYNKMNFGSHEDIFPTLYNLTLSEQSYFKLGEDLLNEDGIAMNSSGIIANKDGAYHHGKFWQWNKGKLIPSEEKLELNNLRQRAQSFIGLTDFYLKEEKSRKNSAEESDQQ